MGRLRLSTYNYKYTIIQPETGPMYLLRYDERWSSLGESIRYGNMILDLAYELQDQRELVVRLTAQNAETLARTKVITEALNQMKEEMARRRS